MATSRDPRVATLTAKRIRAPKTADLVAAQLRRLIVRGDLAEGAMLPSEAELLSQFGVSRPSLREALRVLESEGLILVRRGAQGGAHVHAPSREVAARYAGLVLQHIGTTLADVCAAQTALDAPAAALLARRRTAKDIARLEAVLAEGDPDAGASLPELVNAHWRFHPLIPELCGNQAIATLSGMLTNILDYANVRYAADPPHDAARHIRLSHKAHAKFIELVRRRDAEGAEDLWFRHLKEGFDVTLRVQGNPSVIELLA
jgi:GntR family transcriptional repressor for pyruvate dehydrogenase complex